MNWLLSKLATLGRGRSSCSTSQAHHSSTSFPPVSQISLHSSPLRVALHTLSGLRTIRLANSCGCRRSRRRTDISGLKLEGDGRPCRQDSKCLRQSDAFYSHTYLQRNDFLHCVAYFVPLMGPGYWEPHSLASYQLEGFEDNGGGDYASLRSVGSKGRRFPPGQWGIYAQTLCPIEKRLSGVDILQLTEQEPRNPFPFPVCPTRPHHLLVSHPTPNGQISK